MLRETGMAFYIKAISVTFVLNIWVLINNEWGWKIYDIFDFIYYKHFVPLEWMNYLECATVLIII